EDVAKDRNGTPRVRRDVHPRLGHEARETGRLQRDRFAAGVRPGDDEQVEPVTETNVNGSNRSGFGIRSSEFGVKRIDSFPVFPLRTPNAELRTAEQVLQQRMPRLSKPN